ncbi:hypothetical protein VOLCADRAFT_48983, partial [Volvox carteri f. nagariensis]
KVTRSFGERRNKTHTLCRRCGRTSYHPQKHARSAGQTQRQDTRYMSQPNNGQSSG